MSFLTLPVDSESESYVFQVDLDGSIHALRFDYNTRMDRWVMGLQDLQGNVVLGGVPVQIDWDLLLQYLGRAEFPPGRFVAVDESGQGRDPTRDIFGVEVKLFYEEAA